MRSPSPATAGLAGVGLSLATTAAGGLGAPQWIWIVMLCLAVLAFVLAAYLYVRKSDASDRALETPLEFVERVGTEASERKAQQDRRIKELEFEHLRMKMQARSMIVEVGQKGPHGHSSVPSQNRRGKLVDLGVRPRAVRVSSAEEKVPFDPVLIHEPPATVDIGWGGTVTIRSFESQGIIVDEANTLPKQAVRYEVVEPDDS